MVTQTFLEKSNCTLTEPVNILFDHKMLTANFQLHPRKRGTDYWKFNSELLKDTMYCEKIKYIIKEVRQSYEDVLNKKDIWELIDRFSTHRGDAFWNSLYNNGCFYVHVSHF